MGLEERMRIWVVSGSEQTAYKWLLLYLFMLFSPHLSMYLGTSRPSEFRARVVSA